MITRRRGNRNDTETEAPVRLNGYRHRRLSSDFSAHENGHVKMDLHDDGAKSAFRCRVNILRARMRRLTKGKFDIFVTPKQKRSLSIISYFVSCAVLLWIGVQLPRVFQGTLQFAVARVGGKGVIGGRGGGETVANVPVHAATHRGLYADENRAETNLNGPDGIGPTLAYGIMVYQRKGYAVEKTLGQFTRMFNALYDDKNTYVIHTDIKSSPELIAAITDHVKDLPNVHEVTSVSVSWAGITVVERTLALMDKALEVDPSWQWFVNLGHEDYPSASQTEMRRWMKDQPAGTNYIKCWPIEGHDFFGQRERHDNRCTDVHVDDFMGDVKEYRTTDGRSGSEVRHKSGYRFYKSLQQTTLSRELSEYATRSSEARRLLLYMSTSKAPDELYFPTLTQLDERYSSMATCDDTRHFSFWVRPGGSWHPEHLTLDHLPKVMNATEFYIRKVDEGQGSKPLLDVLDSLREGNPISDSLYVLKAWLNRPNVEGGPIITFAEGSAQDALDELSRRLEEAVEARRCLFLDAITQKRAWHKQQQEARKIPKKFRKRKELGSDETSSDSKPRRQRDKATRLSLDAQTRPREDSPVGIREREKRESEEKRQQGEKGTKNEIPSKAQAKGKIVVAGKQGRTEKTKTPPWWKRLLSRYYLQAVARDEPSLLDLS